MRYSRCKVRWRFIETSTDYWRSDEGIFVFILKALYLEGDRCQEGGEEYWRCVSQLWGEEQYWTGSQVSRVWSVLGWAGLPLTLGSHHTQSYSILCCKLLACCYQLYIIKTFDFHYESWKFCFMYYCLCERYFSGYIFKRILFVVDLSNLANSKRILGCHSMYVVYVSLNLKSVSCPHVSS